MSYIPITLQKLNPDTEQWTDYLRLHALQVNRAGGGEAYSAGREQYRPRLTFDLRWCVALESLRWESQNYRIEYRGRTFNIQDYDDFMEQHRMIRLTGEAYG